jgi:hypothetical protein
MNQPEIKKLIPAAKRETLITQLKRQSQNKNIMFTKDQSH